MHQDIERILIDQQVILKRLDLLAARIDSDFDPQRELVVIALLNGAFMFMADLLRRIRRPLIIDCLRVASYHGGTTSSGQVKFLDNWLPEVNQRDVLILDDILDSGRTLHAVTNRIKESGANSVKSCVLLDKQCQRAVDYECDYHGFQIANEFVVGYGLDYQEKYRNLPYVGILKRELFAPNSASPPSV